VRDRDIEQALADLAGPAIVSAEITSELRSGKAPLTPWHGTGRHLASPVSGEASERIAALCCESGVF
jgi:hypothetical protein